MLHILKMDSCRPESVEIEGDYDVLYPNILRKGGYDGPITHYETRWEGAFPEKVESGDTLLIGGSTLDAFANDEFTIKVMEFVKLYMDQPDIRLIGICYGHQIIARALGSEIYRPAVSELGVLTLELTEEGKGMFPEFPVGGRLVQAHYDQVRELPPNALVLAKSADCPIQSYCIPNKALCIQGHPEFTRNTLLAYVNVSKDPIEVEKARKTLDLPYASAELARGFVRFANRQDQ